MKALIATPSARGTVDMETATSMAQGMALLAMAGIDAQWKIQAGVCFIHVWRDRVMRQALADGYDAVVFLDDDIGFESDALLKLLTHAVDVVGAVCVKRGTGESVVRYAVDAVPGMDVIACEYIGTGLLRLTTKVAQRMMGAYGRVFDIERAYSSDSVQGEDIWFCKHWRAIDRVVWADTSIKTTHAGRHAWTSHL